MPEVTCQQEIPASADKVWALLGDFNGLDTWLGVVTSSTMEGSGIGARRTLVLADGGEIVEKLEALDNAARSLSYSNVSGPLPVERYSSTMQVTPIDGERCKVEWGSTSTAAGVPEEQAEQILNDLYSGGLNDHRNYFG